MPESQRRLKLHGFNNLTKSLSLNVYDVCFTGLGEQQAAYIEYIDDAYNAKRLIRILTHMSEIIGANILNIAHQDYDPQGASVTMLISEEASESDRLSNSQAPGPLPDAVVAHLDKSHVTVHTYPETNPLSGISTFRADIEVSTCGLISPLKVLNYLIHALESDIVIVDYRVRGFTRDVGGRKHFIDHDISSIQNYLPPDIKNKYQLVDINMFQENLFHTKMMVKDFRLEDHLFCTAEKDLSDIDRHKIHQLVRREIMEIFYAHNLEPF